MKSGCIFMFCLSFVMWTEFAKQTDCDNINKSNDIVEKKKSSCDLQKSQGCEWSAGSCVFTCANITGDAATKTTCPANDCLAFCENKDGVLAHCADDKVRC